MTSAHQQISTLAHYQIITSSNCIVDYIREYRRFINSHYLYEGVRVTSGILLPSLLFGYFDQLAIGIFISLGALSVSITDNPGPIHHRRNGMLICCGVIVFVALMVGYALNTQWLFPVLLPLLCFFFSMIGVYGTRATAIGIAALLIMVMMTNQNLRGNEVFNFAAYIFAGGLWYTLLSMVLYKLRPYKLIQQALGEYVLAASAYLKSRAGFYTPDEDINKSYENMMHAQIAVQQKQELIAELLFKSRNIVKESTNTSRILMMIFQDVSDLIERTMSSYQDYRKLHTLFDDTNILEEYHDIIFSLAREMDEIGISLNSGRKSHFDTDIDKILVTQRDRLHQLRIKHLNPKNLEGFISLRHILDSLDDIAARIRTLHQYTSYDPKFKKARYNAPDPADYVTRQPFDPKQFWDNFSFNSSIFRHSIRIALAALIAYITGQFLPVGRSYWILLTVIVILKPGYSLTRTRNIQRLTGTLVGAAFAGLILFFVKNETIILILLAICMIGGYSFVRWKYLVSVVLMTMYLLFMFHILEPTEFSKILQERVIDTLAGCIIAFIASMALPPIWEIETLNDLMTKVITDTIGYFESVAWVFIGKPIDNDTINEMRKNTWVSLANVSDAFNRMLSEPKSKQKDPKALHQFVVSAHMQVSHIATLSYYTTDLKPEFVFKDFEPLIKASIAELEQAKDYLTTPSFQAPLASQDNPHSLLDQKINALMQTRQQELQEGRLESHNKQYISTFKTITDQFYFIFKTSQDLKKISSKLKWELNTETQSFSSQPIRPN